MIRFFAGVPFLLLFVFLSVSPVPASPPRAYQAVDLVDPEDDEAVEIVELIHQRLARNEWNRSTDGAVTMEAAVQVVAPRGFITVTLRDTEAGFIIGSLSRRITLNVTAADSLDELSEEITALLEQHRAAEPAVVIDESVIPDRPPPAWVATQRQTRNAFQLHSTAGRGASAGAGYVRYLPWQRFSLAFELVQGLQESVSLTDFTVLAGVDVYTFSRGIQTTLLTGGGVMLTYVLESQQPIFYDPYWTVIALAVSAPLGPVELFGRLGLPYYVPSDRGVRHTAGDGGIADPDVTLGVRYVW